jgi:hypothetical protein
MGWCGLDWSHSRNKWRAFVNEAVRFGFHKMLGNYRVGIQRLPVEQYSVAQC